jgi:hypothetical protein
MVRGSSSIVETLYHPLNPLHPCTFFHALTSKYSFHSPHSCSQTLECEERLLPLYHLQEQEPSST